MSQLFSPHGGYRKLKSYQTTTIIYDLTVDFCRRYVHDHRLRDQMVHAARSGRQNIAEGCQAAGTSKKTEMKLVSVARASQEELLLDYEDFLRQRNVLQWKKDSELAREVRALGYLENRAYRTYSTYMSNFEGAANVAICLIHQANYLLDRQLQALEKQFLEEGGFTERLYKLRSKTRNFSN